MLYVNWIWSHEFHKYGQIFFFFLNLWVITSWKKRRRQKQDLGQGRGAAILGPNLCAVTALWKYHLFLAAKGAWPSDCLYLHSEETTECCLKIPKETASVQDSICAFLSYPCCFRIEYTLHTVTYLCLVYVDNFHRSMSLQLGVFFFFPAWVFTWPHALYNQINPVQQLI